MYRNLPPDSRGVAERPNLQGNGDLSGFADGSTAADRNSPGTQREGSCRLQLCTQQDSPSTWQDSPSQQLQQHRRQTTLMPAAATINTLFAYNLIRSPSWNL